MKYISCDLCGKVTDKAKRLMMMDEGNLFRGVELVGYDICPDCVKELNKRINDVKKFGPKE